MVYGKIKYGVIINPLHISKNCKKWDSRFWYNYWPWSGAGRKISIRSVCKFYLIILRFEPLNFHVVPYFAHFLHKYQIAFRVPDLNVACTDRCEEISVECITNCETDSACISLCVRETIECTNGNYSYYYEFKFLNESKKIQIIYSACPCELNCLDGCDDCDNPVCDCQVKLFCFSLRLFTPETGL